MLNNIEFTQANHYKTNTNIVNFQKKAMVLKEVSKMNRTNKCGFKNKSLGDSNCNNKLMTSSGIKKESRLNTFSGENQDMKINNAFSNTFTIPNQVNHLNLNSSSKQKSKNTNNELQQYLKTNSNSSGYQDFAIGDHKKIAGNIQPSKTANYMLSLHNKNTLSIELHHPSIHTNLKDHHVINKTLNRNSKVRESNKNQASTTNNQQHFNSNQKSTFNNYSQLTDIIYFSRNKQKIPGRNKESIPNVDSIQSSSPKNIYSQEACPTKDSENQTNYQIRSKTRFGFNSGTKNNTRISNGLKYNILTEIVSVNQSNKVKYLGLSVNAFKKKNENLCKNLQV